MKNFQDYKNKFTQKAREAGLTEEYILKCLNYSEKIFSKNLPIIYNYQHLSELVGYKHTYITRVKKSTYFFYRHFKIKKKNGTSRTISEPLPNLKEIQNFILKEILYTQKVSKYCKSYIPKKNIKEYLKYHINEKQVLTIDIENFFPSIKFTHVLNLFINFNYAQNLAETLSFLCTYIDIKYNDRNDLRYLPQGAPTSPYLSNLILKNFDDKIAEYCFDNKIKYTRYADDMAFSGNEINKEQIIEFVQSQLLDGLNINMDKVNFMKQNHPQIISGVIVNEKLQLPKKERNHIRNQIHHIKTHTLQGHLKWINENRENYLSHLLGKIQYGINLNPKDNELIKYKEYIISLKEKNIII
ncbi:reverse transcriptase family protein [uncultured Chryseobacterium sp.]|uniref:reverse transcriptase family protein n=1 Tax=uncultured Chryseobacterium sp. TaxID=259322 RepID=UPI0025D33149|nr:reverse transcriptase family protein [uncultured Chryseobacterium sp.]